MPTGSLPNIVTRLQTGRSGVQNPVGERDFFPKRPDRPWRPVRFLLSEQRRSFREERQQFTSA